MEIITDSHEWIKREEGVVVVGITKKASAEIGEIVYVELPKVGDKVKKGQEVVILESTKAAIDSYAPMQGVISEVNERVAKEPVLINSDPEGAGWLYKIII